MMKKVLIGLGILVAGFAVIVALQPSHYRVERKATISAPAPAIFAQVNDFHNWAAWSPWEKLDPDARITFDGPAAGTGAVTSWAGNDQVGEGRMTIAESRPSELIRIKLEFLKPFASTSTAEFTLQPVGDQTEVTWSMSGENNFLAKAMCMFMDMDKMIGTDFEKGLAQLRSVAETTPRP